MRPVRFLPLVVVTLTLLVAFASPVQANCHSHETEVLDVPMPQGAPPTLDGIEVLEAVGAAYHVEAPPVGREYHMSTSLDVSMCTLGVCASLPDYNVAWYDANGMLIRDDQDLGSFQGGIVPDDTTDGLVYFRTAQYVFTTPLQENWFSITFYC